jgi:hypothetical protein
VHRGQAGPLPRQIKPSKVVLMAFPEPWDPKTPWHDRRRACRGGVFRVRSTPPHGGHEFVPSPRVLCFSYTSQLQTPRAAYVLGDGLHGAACMARAA